MTKTITVGTQAELLSALKGATGGETILLSGGNYGNLSLIHKSSFNLNFPSTVTIKAADPENPPVVTGLDARNVANLSFQGITFDYVANEGAPLWIVPFQVTGATNISFDGCTFDGDIARGRTEVDNGFPTGHGLAIGGSTGVSVTNCEFFHFWKGMSVGGSNDVVVANNEIHHIRMDGMTFSAVQGVVIEDNHIHNFLTSPTSADHSDMIQFWTTNTTRPSTDIVIRNNVLDIGDNGATQSIFMRNELVDTGKAGAEMFYKNVLIDNNVIVNGHLHGITVGESNGLTITRNSVLHSDGNVPDGRDPVVEIPRISVSGASQNVVITHNATSAIAGHTGQASWQVKMNAFVQDQDPNAPGWYGDVFVTSSLTAQDGLHAFIARPDSMLDTLGAGATSILQRPAGVLDAAFNIADTKGNLYAKTFDASATSGLHPDGALYMWQFSDGTVISGQTVTHSFAKGGQYDVKLTVTSSGGATDQVKTRVVVEDPLVVRLGDAGGFFASAAGTESFIDAAMPLDADGNLQLGGSGAAARIQRTHLERIFVQDDVTFDLRLRTDAPGNSGEVFRLHDSILTTVRSSGQLEVKVWSSEGGAVTLVSEGIINDGKFHDIQITLDAGRLALSVDGAPAQQAAFKGTIAAGGNHDLTFGSGWAAKNLEGDLDVFQIRVVDGTPAPAVTNDIVTTEPVDTPVVVEEPADTPSVVEEPADTPAVIEDALVVRLGDAGGFFATSAGGTEALIDTPMPLDADGNLQLGGPVAAARIQRTHLERIFGQDDVTFDLRLRTDAPGNSGEVFRLHDSIRTTVMPSGEVQVTVWSSAGGAVTLVSKGIVVNDGKFHDIQITLDAGRLALSVDGTPAQQAAFNGTIAAGGNHDLTFGSGWAAKNLEGDLDVFAIRVSDAAPPPAATSLPASVDDNAPQEPAPPEAEDSGNLKTFDGASETVAGTADTTDTGTQNGVLSSTGEGSDATRIDNVHLDQMFGTGDVTISFRMVASQSGETGAVFRINGSVTTEITTSGELMVHVHSDTGATARLVSSGARVNDGQAHDVDIRLGDGRLSLWINDKMTRDTAFDGAIADKAGFQSISGTGNINSFGEGGYDFLVGVGDDPMAASFLYADAPLI